MSNFDRRAARNGEDGVGLRTSQIPGIRDSLPYDFRLGDFLFGNE